MLLTPAARRIRLTQPRHRRDVPNNQTDPASRAACVEQRQAWCGYGLCPQHRPADYADAMARHATDSL